MAFIAGAQAAEVSPSRLTGILPLRTEATIRTVTATIRDVVRYVQSRARSPQSRRGRARRRLPGRWRRRAALRPLYARRFTPAGFSLPLVKDKRTTLQVTFWMVNSVYQVESRHRLNPVAAFCCRTA